MPECVGSYVVGISSGYIDLVGFDLGSDDYTLKQLHTVPTDELEVTVNNLFTQQAAMILGAGCFSSNEGSHHQRPQFDANYLVSSSSSMIGKGIYL